MRTFDLSPLFRASVGFDNLTRVLDSVTRMDAAVRELREAGWLGRNIQGSGFDFDFKTIKGAGEAGSIGSCPAVMNAIVDALDRACGVRDIDMPATPLRVWETIQKAKRGKAA